MYDPYYDKVVLACDFKDLTGGQYFTDRSVQRHTFSAYGNPQIHLDGPIAGARSCWFPGTSASYLWTNDPRQDFYFGVDPWTIEFWMKSSGSTGTYAGPISIWRQDVAHGSFSVLSRILNVNGLQFHFYTASNSWSSIDSFVNINDGRWHKVSICRNGTVLRIYVDITLCNTITININQLFGRPSYGLHFGYEQTDNTFYNGLLSNIRITKGVCRYDAVTLPTLDLLDFAPYHITGKVVDSAGLPTTRKVRAYRRSDALLLADTSSAEGDPYFNHVMMLLSCDGADGDVIFKEEGPYIQRTHRCNVATGQVVLSANQSKFGKTSLYLKGITQNAWTYTDYAVSIDRILGVSSNNPSGGYYTVEFWIYINAYNANGGRLFGAGGGAVAWNSTTGIAWYAQTVSNGVMFAFLGDPWTSKSISVPVALGGWHHVAFSCSDAHTVLGFVDGVLQATLTSSVMWAPSGTPSLTIGAIPGEGGAAATYAANAYLNEIRITKGIGRYTANFTPPTAPFPRKRASGVGMNYGTYALEMPTQEEAFVIASALDNDGLNSLILDHKVAV